MGKGKASYYVLHLCHLHTNHVRDLELTSSFVNTDNLSPRLKFCFQIRRGLSWNFIRRTFFPPFLLGSELAVRECGYSAYFSQVHVWRAADSIKGKGRRDPTDYCWRPLRYHKLKSQEMSIFALFNLLRFLVGKSERRICLFLPPPSSSSYLSLSRSLILPSHPAPILLTPAAARQFRITTLFSPVLYPGARNFIFSPPYFHFDDFPPAISLPSGHVCECACVCALGAGMG